MGRKFCITSARKQTTIKVLPTVILVNLCAEIFSESLIVMKKRRKRLFRLKTTFIDLFNNHLVRLITVKGYIYELRLR